MRLPGSAHLGIGKAILSQYPWWEFVPHQEWVSPAADAENPWQAYAAGIPRRVRVIYIYHIVWGRGVTVQALEPDVRYAAAFINPSTGEVHPLGSVEPNADGDWLAPQQPELRDWVLVLEAE